MMLKRNQCVYLSDETQRQAIELIETFRLKGISELVRVLVDANYMALIESVNSDDVTEYDFRTRYASRRKESFPGSPDAED